MHQNNHSHNIDTMDEVVDWSDFAFPGTEKIIGIIAEKIFHMGIKSRSLYFIFFLFKNKNENIEKALL